MDEISKQALLSAVRTLLAAAGAWMATHKYIDSGSADQIVGAIMIILPISWGVWDKFVSEKKTQVREVAAVNAGIAVAGAGVVGPTINAADVPAIIKDFAPSVVKPTTGATP